LRTVNILATRGVAFVTYRHEHAAQFAKEAMMNQSLDQEEILNVRWATEDPNPSAISREKRRIERIGDEALRSKVIHVKNGEVLEAAAVVQALENGDEAGLNAIMPSAEQEEAAGGASKRARTDDGGLLGSEALKGMRYLLERRKEAEQQAQASDLPPPPPPSAAAPAKSGLAGALGGYGSESDDE
jgi:hypothetical protein